MSAHYPIMRPYVEVFTENRIEEIRNLDAYKKKVPEVTKKSPAAENLSKILAGVDKLIASQFGIDGLPILIKYNRKYFVVSGQLTLAAARLTHRPVVCNVYHYKKFTRVLDELAYVAAYVKPFAISQYTAAHQAAPHTSNGNSSGKMMPYHYAAAIDAYNKLDTPITRVMPESLLNTLRALELLGISSKSGLQRLAVELGFRNPVAPVEKGQPVHPDFHFER